jgi:UDP-3-O-[3-hydroxymyristoyl] glucosamine N-acyltransferase
MKKYELATNTKMWFGRKLYQIKALKDFGNVKAGNLGGYIEKEENLSHDGNAWVYDSALVYDNAKVFDNAEVYSNAWVHDSAKVYDNAQISGNARIFGNAKVCGYARILNNALIYDDTRVFDDAWVYGNAQVYCDTHVYGNAKVFDNAEVFDNARVFGDAHVYDNAWIYRDAQISNNADYIYFKGFGSENRNTTIFKTKNRDVYVSCGCFTGSLRAFMDKVKETHGNTKYAKEYLACIEVTKIHFEIDE